MFEKEAEEYRKDIKSKFFLSEPQLDLACQGYKDGAELGYNKANVQLTKAKEIIKKVARMYRYSPRVEEIIEQAEQFLKETQHD
jgi:hypothetical protein